MISQRTCSFESKMKKEIPKMNPVPDKSQSVVVIWQKCWEMQPSQANGFIHHQLYLIT